MKILLITLLISFGLHTQAQEKPSPELVIHLLDYLAKDYAGAVQNGKVISQGEYSEQVEFIDIVVKNANGNEKLNTNQEFISEITKLQIIIKSKGSADEVSKLARSLQAKAIDLAQINVAPTAIPDLSSGQKLFQSNCVACHPSSP